MEVDETNDSRQQGQVQNASHNNKPLINYTSHFPTLRRMALVLNAVRLWSYPYVKHCIRELCRELDDASYDQFETYFGKVKLIVFKELDEIHLPPSLKTEIWNFIIPVGEHMINFLGEIIFKHRCAKFYFEQNILMPFTMEGTVDKAKFITELIKQETRSQYIERSFSYSELYNCACHYCLEDYARLLWWSMSSEERDTFLLSYQGYRSHLIAYWTDVIRGELHSFVEKIKRHDPFNIYKQEFNSNQNAISICIQGNNTVAFKYFWNKLEAREKNEDSLLYWLDLVIRQGGILQDRDYKCYDASVYILFFLLSHSSIQRTLFRDPKWCYCFLKCLFHNWPLRNFFLPTIRVMLHTLDHSLVEILCHVFYMEYAEIQKGNLKKSDFGNIWWYCNPIFKMVFVQSVNVTFIILKLMEISDIETVCMILESVTDLRRKRIMFQLADSAELYDMLYSHSWNLFDQLLSINLSTNDIIRFKLHALVTYANYWVRHLLSEPCEEFINWAFQAQNKIKNIHEIDIHPLKIYIALVFLEDYERADDFLDNCFRTEEARRRFRDFLFDKDCEFTVIQLINFFSFLESDGWHRFLDFIHCTFESADDINRFKSTYLKHVNSFLYNTPPFSTEFEFCESFLKWCLSSEAEVIQFKNTLMLTIDLLEPFYDKLLTLVNHRSMRDWMIMRRKLQWFSPFKETIDTLKSSLLYIILDVEVCFECAAICMKHNKKLIMVHLLDTLVEGNHLETHFNLEDILEELSEC